MPNYQSPWNLAKSITIIWGCQGYVLVAARKILYNMMKMLGLFVYDVILSCHKFLHR